MCFIINVMMAWRVCVYVCRKGYLSFSRKPQTMTIFMILCADSVMNNHLSHTHTHMHAALKSDFIDYTMIRIMLNSCHNYKLIHSSPLRLPFVQRRRHERQRERKEKENSKLPFHLKMKIKIKIPENDLLSVESSQEKSQI